MLRRLSLPILTDAPTISGDLGPNYPGDHVLLVELPAGLSDSSPPENQQAIKEVMGRPIQFKAYDDDGRAGLEFKNPTGGVHLI
jgi:hypothetical protein